MKNKPYLNEIICGGASPFLILCSKLSSSFVVLKKCSLRIWLRRNILACFKCFSLDNSAEEYLEIFG